MACGDKEKYSCLANTIALRGLCEDSADKLYVNNLPSLDLRKFANVADADIVTATNLFSQLVAFSEIQVINDLIHGLGSEMQFNTVIKSLVMGSYSDTNFSAVEDVVKSICFERQCDDPYVSVNVEWIEFWSDVDGINKDFTVTVDTVSTSIIQHRVTAGINRIYINKTGQKICITVNTCDLSLGWGSRNCASATDCGACASMVTDFGVRASVCCVCDKTDFFCKYVSEWSMAALYHVGIQLHLNNIGNESKNPLVRNTKEDSRYWVARWEGTPDPKTGFNQKGVYPEELKKAIDRIKRSLQPSLCLSCVGYSVKTVKF